jgi:hypothetical protein
MASPAATAVSAGGDRGDTSDAEVGAEVAVGIDVGKWVAAGVGVGERDAAGVGVGGAGKGVAAGVGVAVAVGAGEGVGVGGGVAGAAGTVAEAWFCCQSLILPAALTARMV